MTLSATGSTGNLEEVGKKRFSLKLFNEARVPNESTVFPLKKRQFREVFGQLNQGYVAASQWLRVIERREILHPKL